jgi:hypothetical protein
VIGARRSRAVLGVAVFLATLSVGGVGWAKLGALTGVLAMCATAPWWWASMYFLMGLSLPIVAVWLGFCAAKHHAELEGSSRMKCRNSLATSGGGGLAQPRRLP